MSNDDDDDGRYDDFEPFTIDPDEEIDEDGILGDRSEGVDDE